MRHRSATLAAALAFACLAADEPEDGLRMSKPVVVAKIRGYKDFEPLPEAVLTPDDKLTIYYEPSGQAIEKTADGFRSALAEDARLRKKGSKDVLWEKAPMFESEFKDKAPPYLLFMRTDIAIKAVPPGEYELDLTLRDKLKKDAKVTRTVAFKVVRGKEDADVATEPPEPEPAKKEPAKKKRRR